MTARLFVDVEGRARSVEIGLREGDQTLARSAPVPLNGATRILLEFEPQKAGLPTFTFDVTAQGGLDQNPDDSRIVRRIPVERPLAALYLGSRLRGSRAALADLIGPGVELSEPSTADLSDVDLRAFDLVILDDRPAAKTPRAFQERLATAVRERGLGLFASGGSGAFGAGGYHETPIEEILPVEFVQKEEKKDPSTSLAIIIDTSGSMSGNRIRLAKEVTRLAIRRLLPHDKVGIVEFYGTKRWAAPLQSAANAIDIQRALNRLDAGGGTVLFPAVEEAYYGLRNMQTRYKHCLVLTDAGVESGAYEQLMRKMARDGISVSTVLGRSGAPQRVPRATRRLGQRAVLPRVQPLQPARGDAEAALHRASAGLPTGQARPARTAVAAAGGDRSIRVRFRICSATSRRVCVRVPNSCCAPATIVTRSWLRGSTGPVG